MVKITNKRIREYNKKNDKTISPSTIRQPVTSNIQSSDSDNDSEDESLTTPKLVDQEVSKKCKTSINSNLTDNTINGEEFHSANTGHLIKLLNDLMKEVKKITRATRGNVHHSTDNVTKDSGTSVNTKTAHFLFVKH